MPEKLKLNKHLYLIGPRGAGKSRVGRLLAAALKTAFHDLDEVVRREQGRSIEIIVAEQGWAAFRNLESEALFRLAELPEPAVIATGGGVVLDGGNCGIMRRSGTIVYLKAPLEVLIARLKHAVSADHRPALTGLPLEQEMAQILREREHLYTDMALTAVNAAAPPKDVVAAILEHLNI